MGLNKMIEAVAILAILAASTGQLPRIIRSVQIAGSGKRSVSNSYCLANLVMLPLLLQLG